MKRRTFLAGAASASLAGTACRRQQSSFRTLTDAEAQTLRTLCGQIVPSDDYPGADEAGAVQFIDIQLTRHYKPHREKYRQGLEKADALAAGRFGRPAAQLSREDQARFAQEFERTAPDFFTMLVAHTMQSFYGSPRHGGNHDAVSWRMVGVPPVPVRGRDQYDFTKGGRS